MRRRTRVKGISTPALMEYVIMALGLSACAGAVEDFSTGLERLAHLASVVLNEHVNDHGRCNDCGLTWPCERVLLAEHNLAVL
jgi:hypothetical protein